MAKTSKFSYVIKCLLNMSGSPVPREVTLTADDEEEAVAAFKAWYDEHRGGFDGLPHCHPPYLMQERLLARAEDFE